MSLFAINTSTGPVFFNPAAVVSIYRFNEHTCIATREDDQFLNVTTEPLEAVVNRYQQAVGSSRTYSNMLAKIEKESK
jgi:hypothetical protein